MNKFKSQRGFTLIELLVVIAIIGILASVVLASLNTARSKARDAQRIAGIKSIQNALELYYSDNGVYPGNGANQYYLDYTSSAIDGCGWVRTITGTWCLLEQTLSPYISKLPRDPLGNQDVYIYKYKYIYSQSTHPGPDSYGLSVVLENPNSVSQNDGGYYSSSFEVGGLPSYCKNAYSGTNSAWDNWSGLLACAGGN